MPAEQIDARYFDSPYYIVPNDNVGQDAFAVIRDAMKGKGMVGVGRVVISKRERPIILEPFGKGMRGDDAALSVRGPRRGRILRRDPRREVPGEMLKLAEHIVETKAGDFDPSEFVDQYETRWSRC